MHLKRIRSIFTCKCRANFWENYTVYEYFDDRDLSHLYYRCRYFHIDDDHRIYFKPLILTQLVSQNMLI